MYRLCSPRVVLRNIVRLRAVIVDGRTYSHRPIHVQDIREWAMAIVIFGRNSFPWKTRTIVTYTLHAPSSPSFIIWHYALVGRNALTALLRSTNVPPFIVRKSAEKTYNKQSALNGGTGDDGVDHTTFIIDMTCNEKVKTIPLYEHVCLLSAVLAAVFRPVLVIKGRGVTSNCPAPERAATCDSWEYKTSVRPHRGDPYHFHGQSGAESIRHLFGSRVLSETVSSVRSGDGLCSDGNAMISRC